MLDPHTVEDPEDVINVDICSPMGGAELAFFRFDSRHRWYWLSNMTPDEIVVFTQWDTHPPNGKFNRKKPPPPLPLFPLRLFKL